LQFAKKLESVTLAIEAAENLAKDSITEEEVAKVIKFLDPNNDGSVDMLELEAAFRLSRKDSTLEVVDLEKQAEQVKHLNEKLKALNEEKEEESDFTENDIDTVVKFMDPNRDGITTDEFEAGFRSARRARSTKEAEIAGREALTKLEVSERASERKWLRQLHPLKIPHSFF